MARAGARRRDSRRGRFPNSGRPAVKRGWSVEIGEGYSSPVVGQRPRLRAQPPRSRRDRHRHRSRDRQGGVAAEIHCQSSRRTSTPRRWRKGPNSTPLVVGTRLFTLGVTGILTAWNVADGTVAWRKDYSSSIDTSKLFCGTAMSPMLEGGALIVQVGSDVHGGRVLALDPATGKERWSSKGLGPGYASPLAVTIDRRAADHHDDQRLDHRHRCRPTAPRCGRFRFPTNGTRTSSRRSGPAVR